MSLTCGNCHRDVTALDKKRGWCRACNEERADEDRVTPDQWRPSPDRLRDERRAALVDALDQQQARAVYEHVQYGEGGWDDIAAALAAVREQERERWRARIGALAASWPPRAYATPIRDLLALLDDAPGR